MTILIVRKPHMGVERTWRANEETEECVQIVERILAEQKHFRYRYDVVQDISDALTKDGRNISNKYDRVITIGGDGTLLHASHYIDRDTPVLAINSSPSSSEGYFCGTSPVRKDFKDTVLSAVRGDLPFTEVTRMSVVVDRETVTNRALNDALFCHSNPAMTSRYALQDYMDGSSEEQMSSGVWFSTAVGSTGAMRSAGGFTSPHESPNLQYIVREPFQPAGKRLQRVHGFCKPGHSMVLISKIEDGHVYVDGAHINRKVGRNERLYLRASDEPLCLQNFRQGDED